MLAHDGSSSASAAARRTTAARAWRRRSACGCSDAEGRELTARRRGAGQPRSHRRIRPRRPAGGRFGAGRDGRPQPTLRSGGCFDRLRAAEGGDRRRSRWSWTQRSRHYAAVIERDLGMAVADVPGAGAAGGLGAGLIAFLRRGDPARHRGRRGGCATARSASAAQIS